MSLGLWSWSGAPRGQERGVVDVIKGSLHVIGLFVLDMGSGMLGKYNIVGVVYMGHVECVDQVPWLGSRQHICMSVCRCRWTYLYAISLDSWAVWIGSDDVEWFEIVLKMCVQRFGGLDLIPEVVGIF